MKIKIVTLIICLVSFISITNAQDSYIKNRWSFKLGYTQEPIGESANRKAYGRTLQGSLNYGILNNLELGLNLGYSRNFDVDFTALSYSINCNYHILPYFIKAEDFRVDAYLIGEIGGDNRSLSSMKEDFIIYGTGVGFMFYPFKRLGVFGEYQLGRYLTTNHKFEFGLAFKLRKK